LGGFREWRAAGDRRLWQEQRKEDQLCFSVPAANDDDDPAHCAVGRLSTVGRIDFPSRLLHGPLRLSKRNGIRAT
jgi:hypothetical protein